MRLSRAFSTFLLSLSMALLPTVSANAVENKPDAALSTLAEQSGWKKTARYEEAVRLCRAFEKKYKGRASCQKFGTTPEGREMLSLVISESGVLTAKAAQARIDSKGTRLPVMLAQGSIHAGECDGKDAGFFVARELLEHRMLPGALKKLVFVFVPVFNVDGHERFGPNHRPNQDGPEEMGWRVTSQGLNLNRDYVKAEAPEMQAMLGLLNAWDPIVYADLHVTDGADFQHDISTIVMPRLVGPTDLRKFGGELSDTLMRDLKARKHLPLPFYPDFRTEGDPTTGFNASVSSPRYSEAYWSVRNRIGVLVETHSWKDYGTRVRATIDALEVMLGQTAENGVKWALAGSAADREDKRAIRRDVVLKYQNTAKSTPVEFLGYAYDRRKSEISGDFITQYDRKTPKAFSLPLYAEVEAKVMVKSPIKGYYVPPSVAAIVEPKLKAHGVKYYRTGKTERMQVEVFRCETPEFGKSSYEGRQSLSLKGEWKEEAREISAGTIFVTMGQDRALIAMHLLEPLGPDSLASWGFFNTAFERREYMEAYVTETVALGMLDKDPAVKREFERLMLDDPEFRKDSARRLDFFYRKHPSWDERYGLYPVYRL